MNIAVSIHREENASEAVVSLRIEIGEPGELVPFHICATESAGFRWEADLQEANVDNLLNQNAPALLLSYLRPVITQITAASPYEAYNIPFVNFKK